MANAEEGAIAARADQHPECPELRRSPKTMYDSCLRAFVKNRKNPDLSTLRFLPPSVIIDIMHTMAKDTDAHPLFCRQLADVRLLSKLLNYPPARQRFFRCLGMVMEKGSTKDHCVHIISDAFVEFVQQRYDFVDPTASPLSEQSSDWVMKNRDVHSYKPGAKLRKLSHQRRKQINFSFFHDEELHKLGGGRNGSNPSSAYAEQMEREEEEEDYFGAAAKGGESRDYFFYTAINNNNSSTSATSTEEATTNNNNKNNPSTKRQAIVKTTDLKRSDQVWERVFEDASQTVDKQSNSSSSRNRNKSNGKSKQQPVDDEDPDLLELESMMEAQEVIYLIRQRPFMATINMGLQIGSFLAEAGWLYDAIHVYQETCCMIQCLDHRHADYFMLYLDCLQRILNAESRFCLFNAAHRTSMRINGMVEEALQRKGFKLAACLLARVCRERSMMHFLRSEYDMSFNWSVRALQLMHHGAVAERVAINVLLQAGKACVVKRQYKRANLLLTMAVSKTLALYGKKHQKYADALLDYGFYLLNVDLIVNSVNVYREALEIKKKVFGALNLNVGTANEDLAYALYVKEYSSGLFTPAREHIDMAIKIMDCLVPWNRLMLASAQRVKALILEEIALDQGAEPLLEQSEKLHESALQLSLEAFGEVNVQTAKHYGNLGRLYQSMMRFDAAETMHKRAIKIKTDLLGAYDYEVGLSIGHLASLYNYQMNKYREAEELYMKSIEISLRLFGESYSGLEYDYRGLCHIYELLNDLDKYIEYSRILDNWRNLRRRNEALEQLLAAEEEQEDNDSASVDEVIGKFFDAGENGNGGVATENGGGGGGAGNRGSSVS